MGTPTQMAFPFSWSSHEVGWRFMFDLSVLGSSLECAPDDLILDYACGTGYVTEMLNRFGYRTIALDRDPGSIEIAKARLLLDSRLYPERAEFIVGDCLEMPFSDDTFDGVVCMNALHHMPDYLKALREIHRVLKPGCRAVFSEPGSTHSTTALSAMMIRQFGETERDLCLDEICRTARSAGFEQVLIKPYLLPPLYTLREDEWHMAKSGHFLGSCIDPDQVCRIVEKTHPIFVLVKAGKRPATSARPGVLIGKIRLDRFDLLGDGPYQAAYKVRVTNLGDCVWLSKKRVFGGYVVLGAKLLAPDGRLLSDTLDRQMLPADVAPWEEVELSGIVNLGDLAPGEYVLRLDMIDEHICWFEERAPGYLDIRITV